MKKRTPAPVQRLLRGAPVETSDSKQEQYRLTARHDRDPGHWSRQSPVVRCRSSRPTEPMSGMHGCFTPLNSGEDITQPPHLEHEESSRNLCSGSGLADRWSHVRCRKEIITLTRCSPERARKLLRRSKAQMQYILKCLSLHFQ